MELHLVMRKALRDEEKERGRRNERKKSNPRMDRGNPIKKIIVRKKQRNSDDNNNEHLELENRREISTKDSAHLKYNMKKKVVIVWIFAERQK